MTQSPCLIRTSTAGGEVRFALGDPLVDSYLAFVGGRSRPNTLRAVAHDLKTFFTVVDKEPAKIVAADIFAFSATSAAPAAWCGSATASLGCRPGRSLGGCRRSRASTRIWLPAVTPGSTRTRCRVGCRPVARGGRRTHVPLVRVPSTLPKILSPGEVTALLGALRTQRDRAMVFAMVLGALRRCEVLGLRLGDVQVPERSLFIAEGKGGHQRVIPISNTIFTAVGDYLQLERPSGCATDRVFVTLKGPNRGKPMTSDGVDKVLQAARARAGLKKATCHQLRHTCLTRLREAGMQFEAVQAQAGHVWIESTRIYLHLTDDWLAGEYRRASERIDADAAAELVAMQAMSR